MSSTGETGDKTDDQTEVPISPGAASAQKVSLSGKPQKTPSVNEKKELKRKFTDPNLQVITIDTSHDLTLIVGSSEHVRGQKAFQVSKSSFRHASKIWKNMLDGGWAEGEMWEIRLPEDSCFAIELVLRIAHLQLDTLPAKLTQEELTELAILSDKYDLKHLLYMLAKYKRWISVFKENGTIWPASIDLQKFLMITSAFGLESAFDHLVHRFSMELKLVDNELVSVNGNLREDLPPTILTRIKTTRLKLLRDLLYSLKSALKAVLEKRVGECQKYICPMTQAGLMLKALDAAGLYPLPQNEHEMSASFVEYYKVLITLGKAQPGTSRVFRPKTEIEALKYQCEYRSDCYGDFGFQDRMESWLKRYAHESVWKLGSRE